ncbi:MAG: ABC-type multidrug transport system, ATPase and permease component [Microgenomates group bacterium GW2011_GWC2_46_7]|nr:MAG: ABC-type multidrug transport system, ATPase and permease component [Microgenomates group bacterium GW2011_GWC2_46_7]
MKLLFSYLKHYKKILFLPLALATINQFFALMDPQIMRLIVDRYVMKADTLTTAQFLPGVLILVGLSILVAFISRVAKNFQDYYVSAVVQRIGARLYGDSVAHAFSLPYGVFEDQRSGELLQKFQKARTDCQSLITSFISTVFLPLITIVIVVVYAFFVHWMVGVAYVLLIPAVGFVTFFISRKIKEMQREIVLQSADLAGSTTETLRNVELVKSLGLESQEVARLNDVNEDILDLEMKKIKMIRKLSFLQGTSIHAIRTIVLLLMYWLIFIHDMSVGQYLTLFLYSFFVFNPLGELATVSTQYQEARASLETVQHVFNLQPASVPENPKKISTLSSIVFQHVSFMYNGDSEIISDISFSIPAGNSIAFVGLSGSGKSTLLKLLLGLYQAQQGSISINGIDAKILDFDQSRKKIGYVSQETQLFAGTIRENLLFVNPDATDAQCLQSLEHASARSLVERAGKGLDTKIGEGGIKLSGGERQRLAIARALLRNPDLIIFDEATSSLDSLTEKAITETIQQIKVVRPNLTMILVAHRLSTIAHVDTIYVLEKGKIIESGNHQQLLEQDGLYSALWREQSAA